VERGGEKNKQRRSMKNDRAFVVHTSWMGGGGTKQTRNSKRNVYLSLFLPVSPAHYRTT
jgi:hypothetical protein